MLTIVVAVLLVISECGAESGEGNWDIRNQTTECRPMEDVLRSGGCSPSQFLCHDKNRVKESLLSPSEMKLSVYWKTACFCDPSCWKFKDCCVDATPVEPTLEDDIRWQCEAMRGSGEHVYVVSSCPPEWNDPTVVARCERKVSDDQYNYLLDIPVFSNQTHKAYSNIYCAKCHQDVRLSSFHVDLTCPVDLANCKEMLHQAYYIPGEYRWRVDTEGKHMGSFIYFSVEEFRDWEGLKKSYGVRRCQPVVDSCSNDKQLEYVGNCTSHYASYVITDGFLGSMYKNFHCALCNNISLASSVQCYDGVALTQLPVLYPRDEYGLPNCTSGAFAGGGRGSAGGYSFSLLFDFYDPLGRNEVGLEFRCNEGEILDPVYDVCIPYMCGKQFMKVGGKCVENGFSATQNKTIRQQNCHILPIKKVDIHVLRENNSIYINKTGLTYESSEFQEYDNDTYLVCHSSDLFVDKFSIIQNHLSQVAMAVSLVCLAIHITHISITKLHTLPGKNLISLSISLFIAQIMYLFSFTAVEYPIVCTIIAVATHFCFLASFFWMNIMAFDIYRTFTQAKSRSVANYHNKTFRYYAAYAWVAPLIIVLMALITDYTHILPSIQPGYGKRICWMSHRQGLLVFFASPLAFLLFANIIFFIMTAYAIYQTTKITRSVLERNKDRVRFFLYVKLALIMGLTWVFGYVAAVVAWDPLWYVFIILNASQGIFIFTAFSLKRKLFIHTVDCLKGDSAEVSSGNSFTKALVGSKWTKCFTSCAKNSTDKNTSTSSLKTVDNSNGSSSSRDLSSTKL